MNNELRDKLAEEWDMGWRETRDAHVIALEPHFCAGWDARDQESANLRILLKDICEEWNEGCELSCDSVAHSENCAAVNIGVAKRKMKEEITALREKLKIAEKALELMAEGEGRDEEVYMKMSKEVLVLIGKEEK